jgi:AcrR family transcriptional regulator
MLSKSERTRLYIIEKAAHLFNKKGFHGTSMSDILEATGLAKGGVYGNFKSKEEIVLEAFEYAFRKVSDELTLRIKSKSTAHDKLNAVVDYYYGYLENSPIEGGCPMLNFTSHSDESLPDLKRAVQKAVKMMLDSIIRIIQKGQQYQQIRSELDAALMGEILFTRIEGALMLAKSTNDPEKLNRLLDACKQFIASELKG